MRGLNDYLRYGLGLVSAASVGTTIGTRRGLSGRMLFALELPERLSFSYQLMNDFGYSWFSDKVQSSNAKLECQIVECQQTSETC
jgi:hypothetical protein